jgi:hypothetical protein
MGTLQRFLWWLLDRWSTLLFGEDMLEEEIDWPAVERDRRRRGELPPGELPPR